MRDRDRPAPSLLGEVASANASLAIVLADAEVARAWTGTGDGDEPAGDWARSVLALGRKSSAAMEIGGGGGVVVAFGVGHGFATFYRVDDRITFAEIMADDDEDERYIAWIAARPGARAALVATLGIASGQLTALPTTDTTALGEQLTFALPKGSYGVVLERPTKAAWGAGRRAHLVGSSSRAQFDKRTT